MDETADNEKSWVRSVGDFIYEYHPAAVVGRAVRDWTADRADRAIDAGRDVLEDVGDDIARAGEGVAREVASTARTGLIVGGVLAAGAAGYALLRGRR